MADSFVTVSNRRLGYTDVGTGPTVLLLHGDTLDRRFWGGLVAELARDHRVVAPDTRGHGLSPDVRGPFSYEDFADDWRVLIDELDLGRVAVVGHSGGACTALLMGLAYPELVRGMVLAGCPYHISNYHDGALEKFESTTLDDYRAWAGYWADHAIAAYGSVEGYGRFWSKMYNELFTREPNLTERELRRITPRSLVLHGELEENWDRVHADDLTRMLPSAELFVAPGANHMTLFSHDPVGTTAEVRRFLSTLEQE